MPLMRVYQIQPNTKTPVGASINNVSSKGEGVRVENVWIYLVKRQQRGREGGHKIGPTAFMDSPWVTMHGSVASSISRFHAQVHHQNTLHTTWYIFKTNQLARGVSFSEKHISRWSEIVFEVAFIICDMNAATEKLLSYCLLWVMTRRTYENSMVHTKKEYVCLWFVKLIDSLVFGRFLSSTYVM